MESLLLYLSSFLYSVLWARHYQRRDRIRPHRNRVAAIYNAVLFLNCHTFVIPTFIRGWFLQYKITSYRYPDEFGGLLDSFYHLILAIVFGLHLV